MCGRYTLRHSPTEIAKRFDVEMPPDFTQLRFNVAPTQLVPIVRVRGEKEMIGCKWGLVPFWAKDPSIGNKMINARAETLAEKPSFKQPLLKRRCLIPADGFYEWAKDGKKKQPMYIHRKDDELFAFAGLWEEWKTPEGDKLQTCTIITTEPNELMAPIHNRMTVLLTKENEKHWLDEAAKLDSLISLLTPYNSKQLEAYPVSTAVNSPAKDEASLIEPISV